jgi:hypothetical protein
MPRETARRYARDILSSSFFILLRDIFSIRSERMVEFILLMDIEGDGPMAEWSQTLATPYFVATTLLRQHIRRATQLPTAVRQTVTPTVTLPRPHAVICYSRDMI